MRNVFEIEIEKDWHLEYLVSNTDSKNTLEWFREFDNGHIEDYKIRQMSDEEIDNFEVVEIDGQYDIKDGGDGEDLYNRGLVNENGYKILFTGKEIFDMSNEPIFICATFNRNY